MFMSDNRETLGQQPRRHISERQKLSQGLAIYRVAGGQVLDTCAELSQLEDEYPALEVRPKYNGKPFGIQLLATKEIWANASKLGNVGLRRAILSIFSSVPSLLEEESVTAETVDTVVDLRTKATFVTVVPRPPDLARLVDERKGITAAVEHMAPESGLTWQRRTPDLTLAYVPVNAGQPALEATMEMVNSFLPLSLDLLRADFTC
jgi:hypothetical protein